jgi:hypothetical protein
MTENISLNITYIINRMHNHNNLIILRTKLINCYMVKVNC